ncbi:hypothetical protein BKA70DRAFT_1264986 [Coprinopsis sp. MPI-PUGE-AT-0042]|nr:hypothetical protein BKA70DRAFT_1264986 [Coprinopsis sp. MPI-PUGE-AT-0042]
MSLCFKFLGIWLEIFLTARWAFFSPRLAQFTATRPLICSMHHLRPRGSPFRDFGVFMVRFSFDALSTQAASTEKKRRENKSLLIDLGSGDQSGW